MRSAPGFFVPHLRPSAPHTSLQSERYGIPVAFATWLRSALASWARTSSFVIALLYIRKRIEMQAPLAFRLYPHSVSRFIQNPDVDNLREILARNLRARMEANPAIRTQELLEKKAGLGQATVSRILNCGGAATLDSLAALAQACECQAWELLVDDDATREAAIRKILGR